MDWIDDTEYCSLVFNFNMRYTHTHTFAHIYYIESVFDNFSHVAWLLRKTFQSILDTFYDVTAIGRMTSHFCCT